MKPTNVLSLPDNHSVSCRFWQDECVVYNAMSGNTHLIDGFGVEVFKALTNQQTTSRVDLLNVFDALFALPPDCEVDTFFDNLVHDYETLGLLQVKEQSAA